MKVYIVYAGYFYEDGYHVVQDSFKCFASKDAAERYKSIIRNPWTIEKRSKYDWVRIIERDIHDDWMVPVD